MIDPNPRVCIIVSKGNWLDIRKVRHRNPKGLWTWDSLKGVPAIYCGLTKEKANYFKQGWFLAHKFLISGECYKIHGDYIKNVIPLRSLEI